MLTLMRIFVAAGVSGFLAVFFGAFGSHVLKDTLGGKFFSVFQTANQYHFWHTLAMLAIAILQAQYPRKFFKAAAISHLTGLFLFSGSLYLYAIYQNKLFAHIAPLGGVAFMLGWLFLVLGSIRQFSRNTG